MFQITVIQAGHFSFFRNEPFFKIQCQLKKRFHGRSCTTHFRFQRFGIRIEQLTEFFHGCFTGFSAILYFIFQLRFIAFYSPDFRETYIRRFTDSIPAHNCTPFQFPYPGRGFSQRRQKDFAQGRIIPDSLCHPGQFSGPVCGRGRSIGKDFLSPQSFPYITGFAAQLVQAFLRPFSGMGMALHFIIKLQNEIREYFIVPPDPDGIHQLFISGIVPHFLIPFIQQLFKRSLPDG